MKLLDKKATDDRKADERLREIKEGAKLAKKIDVLRETFAKEEINLKKFRDEALAKVKEEIMEVLAQKEHLTVEVTLLREEKLRIKKLLETL